MTGKILVVDDEKRIGQLVKVMLESSGYEVVYLDNAEEAFRVVTTTKIDLVIMDLNMPGLNGLEGIRSIKVVKPEQKIVVLTGYSTEAIREKAIAAGAEECLFKPKGVSKLPALAEKLLAVDLGQEES